LATFFEQSSRDLARQFGDGRDVQVERHGDHDSVDDSDSDKNNSDGDNNDM
jgi:hypothetical protein